ncbi:MAG TPA: PKD domain-containing protein [Telluria sp.]|nr:PKD domain-containing protein [Telluria sp.]
MALFTETNLGGRWSNRALLCLLGGAFAACSGGGNDRAAPPPTILAATMTSSDQAAATSYTVINLGAGQIAEIPNINTAGQVAFSVYDPAGSGGHAYFFDGDMIRDIGTLGGDASFTRAINEAGQITGYASYDASGNYHAFMWSLKEGMTDLGTIRPAPFSEGLAINKLGQVAGYSSYIGPINEPLHAFVWSRATGLADLGTLAGASLAQAINDAGQVAGYSDAANGQVHGFLWTAAGGMTDLGTLANGIDSYPTAINKAGQIIGYATSAPLPDLNYHAFVWEQGRGMTDLGTLGGPGSGVWAINALGQIVGAADLASGYQHAFSWTRRGGMADLGTLGGLASSAIGVNDIGHAAGWAQDGKSQYHAFIWTAATGMADLNTRLRNAPAGLVVDTAFAISNKDAIVATSNAGLVLLRPGASGTPAPVVGPVTRTDGAKIGTQVHVLANFIDAGTDTHSAIWTWGDGSAATAGTVSERKGSGSVRGVHRYQESGVYAVAVKVTDNTGRSTTVSGNVTVFDPSSGFVSGEGWFMSPQGAYKGKVALSGRANFSLSSTFRQDVAGAQGSTRFTFNMPGLNFQGSAYDKMGVSGARASFQGSGTLNGKAGYSYQLTALAGDTAQARFRIRIWHTDARTQAAVVDYDNLLDTRAEGTGTEGTAIGGGGIAMHE